MTCNVDKPVKLSRAKFHDRDWKIIAGVAQSFERYIQDGGGLPGIKQQNPRVNLLKVRKSAGTRNGHANLPKTAGAQANKNGGLLAPALIQYNYLFYLVNAGARQKEHQGGAESSE